MEKINIGIVGGGLIGRVHTIAFQVLKGFFAEKARNVSLKVIAEKDGEYARETASRLGIDEWVGDWRELVKRDDIDLVIIGVPNYMHKEIALEAVNRGKHVLCEKPLALCEKDARELYETARSAGIMHAISFNYRKTPAVLLVKRWIEEGSLGTILSFRSSFIQDWGLDENLPLDWHFQKRYSGSGVLGDLGSHAIDMARFLVGEIREVSGALSTLIGERPLCRDASKASTAQISNAESKNGGKKGKVDVDDLCDVLLRFENGAQGGIFVSRVAQGCKNHFEFELYGTEGSVFFDWERPNEVKLYRGETQEGKSGFSEIQVGESCHPYGREIWPLPGMGTGFAEPFAIQLYEMVDALLNGGDVSPNFYDGWKTSQIIDGVIDSSGDRKWRRIEG